MPTPKSTDETTDDPFAEIKEILVDMREILYELKETVVQGNAASLDKLLCPECNRFFCEHQGQ